MAANCTHLDQIHDVEPSAQGCEDCLRTGDTWVHLRECLSCGHIGCCDSSVSPRHQALPRDRAPHSPVFRAGRRLALVLR